MDDFQQQLVSWQPFFMTMAAVCATFAGLLFLALSLHVHQFAEASKANLKRLALHTFADFLLILFIAFFCIVPHTDHEVLGTMLTVLTILGIVQLRKPLMGSLHDRNVSEHRRYFFIRMGISVMARALLLIGAIAMLQNVDVTVIDYWFFIFAGTISLLVSATRNAWFLLVHELN
ncbi:MAG: hypothetical protein ACRES7_09550 [Gammaproteobacteria bacterium]